MKVRATLTSSGGMRVFTGALDGESIRASVNEAARAVRNGARRLIRSRDKSGKEYYRPRGEGHQKYRASRAGEPPARFSGHLVDHVRMYPAKKGGRRLTAWVGSTSPHVHLLEYGTRTMAPRPFMGPAARQARAQNYRNIKAAAKADVQRAARKASAKTRGKGR